MNQKVVRSFIVLTVLLFMCGQSTCQSDPYTVFLLQSETSDGATSFVDSSASKHLLIVHGDVHHSTAAAKFGKSSITFDGSGDYLEIMASPDWDFSTADFTVDYWMMSNNGSRMHAVSFGGTSNNLDFDYNDVDDGGHGLWFYWNSTGSNKVVYGPIGIYTDNKWHHMALVRSGTTMTAYADGKKISSVTYSPAIGNASNKLVLGVFSNGANFFYKGYLEEIRVSKGIARWTSDFTPPTQPY